MRTTTLALAFAAAVSTAIAEELNPYDAQLAELRAISSAQFSISDGWTIVVTDNGRSIWSFTPETHPAHPAFAERKLIQDPQGAWTTNTELHCGGPEKACEELFEEYQALDSYMKESLNNKGKKNGT